MQKAIIVHKIQRIHDSHKKTAGNNGRNNGNKNIPQKLDRPHKDILFLCRRFLGFCLCTGSDTAQAYKFIKYFIDSPCSEDDLELARGLKDSFYSIYVFQCFSVCLRIV